MHRPRPAGARGLGGGATCVGGDARPPRTALTGRLFTSPQCRDTWCGRSEQCPGAAAHEARHLPRLPLRSRARRQAPFPSFCPTHLLPYATHIHTPKVPKTALLFRCEGPLLKEPEPHWPEPQRASCAARTRGAAAAPARARRRRARLSTAACGAPAARAAAQQPAAARRARAAGRPAGGTGGAPLRGPGPHSLHRAPGPAGVIYTKALTLHCFETSRRIGRGRQANCSGSRRLARARRGCGRRRRRRGVAARLLAARARALLNAYARCSVRVGCHKLCKHC